MITLKQKKYKFLFFVLFGAKLFGMENNENNPISKAQKLIKMELEIKEMQVTSRVYLDNLTRNNKGFFDGDDPILTIKYSSEEQRQKIKRKDILRNSMNRKEQIEYLELKKKQRNNFFQKCKIDTLKSEII